MDCKNHKGCEAVYVCRCCGETICLDCTVVLNGKNYCKECLSKMVNVSIPQTETNNKISFRRKSRFLTFCLSMIPGGGHMYLGLINKGLTLMGIFFAALFSIIFVSDALHMNWFSGFLIPAVSILSIFYSVFESLTLVNAINEGRTVSDSEAIRINIDFEYIKLRLMGKRKIIGYVLIILGAIGSLNIVMEIVRDLLWTYLKFRFPFTFSGLVMPLVLVFIGFYLLRKARNEDL